jgi:hypothetical protein
MSLEKELRSTSDSLLRALDRINDLESEKRSLPTGSERFVELAHEIERLALEVLRHTQDQASLADTTEARAAAGGGLGRPVDAIPPAPRELSAILSDWRDAERALAAADPATEGAAIAASDVRRLREEYRLAHEQIAAEKARATI